MSSRTKTPPGYHPGRRFILFPSSTRRPPHRRQQHGPRRCRDVHILPHTIGHHAVLNKDSAPAAGPHFRQRNTRRSARPSIASRGRCREFSNHTGLAHGLSGLAQRYSGTSANCA